MKIIASIAVLLSSTLALAMPAVGDQAHFSMVLVQNGVTMNGTIDMTITAQSTDGFSVSEVMTIQGQSQTSSSVIPATSFLNDQAMNELLANCAQKGGQAQQLTVAAGTFSTCALPTDEGTSWVGAVPFSVVKEVQANNGSTLTFELTGFQHGN